MNSPRLSLHSPTKSPLLLTNRSGLQLASCAGSSTVSRNLERQPAADHPKLIAFLYIIIMFDVRLEVNTSRRPSITRDRRQRLKRMESMAMALFRA